MAGFDRTRYPGPHEIGEITMVLDTVTRLTVRCAAVLSVLARGSTAASVGGARASPGLVLQTTVINCTGSVDRPGFLKPLAIFLGDDGHPRSRISVPAAGPLNLTGIGSTFAVWPGAPGAGKNPVRAYVDAEDEPPGFAEGIRSLLATVRLDLDDAEYRP